MGGSSSSSKTSSKTTTAQTDNRVAATDQGVSIGSNAQVSLIDQFPTAAVDVFNTLVELASTGLHTVTENSKLAFDFGTTALGKATGSADSATSKVAEAYNRSADPSASNFKDLVIPLVLVSGVVLIFILRKK